MNGGRVSRLLRRLRGDEKEIERPSPDSALRGVAIDWSQVDYWLSKVRLHRRNWEAWSGDESPDGAYYWRNPFFRLVDAAVAYTIVREQRPGKIIEVGSGYSTQVLRSALNANRSGTLESIDPSPRIEIRSIVDASHEMPVQDVPVATFESLPANSILFIDSSHRVGAGSDVNHLILEVLPALPTGTLVQVHDIYLPEDYPPDQNLGRAGWHFSEQYLLHALLIGSELFSVEWPGRLVFKERRGEMEALFGDAEELGMHCSFWLRRR